jgi:hypothetical protein
MRSLSIIAQSALVAIYLPLVGSCNQGPASSSTVDRATADSHDHAHADEGPHGGHIIELGAPSHHAELTHDEQSHRVGVYILDGGAKQPAAIAAESVTINVAQDGEPTQYILPAVAQPEDGEGAASYFELVSEPLCKIVCGESEAKTTTARISITIDGKPFIGIIETDPHEHGHDHGHDHGHSH